MNCIDRKSTKSEDPYSEKSSPQRLRIEVKPRFVQHLNFEN